MAIAQHLPSAKSSEGAAVKIYIKSQPSVKSAKRNRLKVSIQTLVFKEQTMIWKERQG